MSDYCVIVGVHRRAGFCAFLQQVIPHIIEAHTKGLHPIIDFGPHSTGVAGVQWDYYDYQMEEENPWDYWFEQPVTALECHTNGCLVLPAYFSGWPSHQLKTFHHKKEMGIISEMFSKYIKVKQHILDKLNTDVQTYKTLAVQCRRSDMASSHANIAMNYTDAEFFEKAYKVYQEGGYERMYLGTEEISIVEYFKEQLGDKLIYTDCNRITTDQSPVSFLQEYIRPKHRYLLGEEILIDILNMGRCRGLVSSLGGVSSTIYYFNNFNFEQVYYFDEI